MVSHSDFPGDLDGQWRLVLKDAINDSMCGTSFVDGVSQEPVSGPIARRLTACTQVVGVMRVDGVECMLGDCSRLLPSAPTLPARASQYEPEPELEAAKPDPWSEAESGDDDSETVDASEVVEVVNDSSRGKRKRR